MAPVGPRKPPERAMPRVARTHGATHGIPGGAARLDSGLRGACGGRSVLPGPRKRARAFDPDRQESENDPGDRFPAEGSTGPFSPAKGRRGSHPKS